MKKTILSVVVGALMVTTAQAAEMYQDEDVSVDIYGLLDVLYFNDTAKDSDEDGIIKIEDADFGFKLGYELDNGTVVGGVVEFSGAEGTSTLGDAYVEVMFVNAGTISMGKQPTIYDDAGIGNDYQFGATSFYEQGQDYGHQVIKYQYDSEMFYAGIAHLLSSEENVNNAESWTDGNVGVRMGGFDFTAFYGRGDAATTDDNSKGKPTASVEQYTLEARYNFENVIVAATYADIDARGSAFFTEDEDGETVVDKIKDTGRHYGLAGIWNIDGGNTTLGAAWFNSDNRNNSETVNKSQNDYFVNVSYAFSDYVNLYAEIGVDDGDNTEVGYATGMQVEF